VFKVSKGAPHVILEMCDDEAVKSQLRSDIVRFASRGIRCLGIARTAPLDPSKPDAPEKWHALGRCSVTFICVLVGLCVVCLCCLGIACSTLLDPSKPDSPEKW